MANKTNLNALNANYSYGDITLANGIATVTCGTAITNAVVNGKFITTPLAATATVMAPVSPLDGTTVQAFTTLAINQACVMVHCVNAAGARKELQGPIVPYNVNDGITGVLAFPKIPDTLTPIAYSTIKNGLTAPFVFGTTLWNATSVVTAVVNVSTLPSRPLTS